MPTRKGEEEWSQQMQEEEDERHTFSDSVNTHRTPAKKHVSPNAEIHAAPRKPAAKARAEENEEPSTATHTQCSQFWSGRFDRSGSIQEWPGSIQTDFSFPNIDPDRSLGMKYRRSG